MFSYRRLYPKFPTLRGKTVGIPPLPARADDAPLDLSSNILKEIVFFLATNGIMPSEEMSEEGTPHEGRKVSNYPIVYIPVT